MAEIVDEVGLPPGVLNVVMADREVSESLVRDHRVDKITLPRVDRSRCAKSGRSAASESPE